jgi:hypothetical protein
MPLWRVGLEKTYTTYVFIEAPSLHEAWNIADEFAPHDWDEGDIESDCPELLTSLHSPLLNRDDHLVAVDNDPLRRTVGEYLSTPPQPSTPESE